MKEQKVKIKCYWISKGSVQSIVKSMVPLISGSNKIFCEIIKEWNVVHDLPREWTEIKSFQDRICRYQYMARK